MKSVLGALLLPLFGCATTGAGALAGTESYNHSQVSGVVVIPANQDPDALCRDLEVRASNAAGVPVGHASVHVSRGRCSFVISQLPAAEELSIQVTPGAAWRCASGLNVALDPPTQAVKLREWESRSEEFRTTCRAS
jgi:hypothetical protein